MFSNLIALHQSTESAHIVVKVLRHQSAKINRFQCIPITLDTYCRPVNALGFVIEQRREYERMKAREYRARKKEQSVLFDENYTLGANAPAPQNSPI